jgi:DNA-binding response OmpR family regulator
VAKILIVDDDRGAVDVLKSHLAARGHTCRSERRGNDALDVLKAEPFDLVILDVMLPGASGFEVCRSIRRDSDLYTTPILIVSAMNGEEELHHGLAQGADDYVVKPFEIQNVLQRVEALLRANADHPTIDEVTSVPGVGSTKRELQRRVCCRGGFALAYSELLCLREFSSCYGTEARRKAIRHLGRALVQCGRDFDSEEFFVGHMGGGHFVCVLPPEHATDYCTLVRSAWKQHLDKFYSSIGHPDGISNPNVPTLDVLFCATLRDPKDVVTPQQLFEILSQIRLKASAGHTGGVHLDRRTLR